MGDFFAELLGELLVKPLLYGLCFSTGRPLIYLLSAGTLHAKLHAPPVNGKNRGKRSKRDKARFRDVALTYVENQKRYLNADLVALLGLAVWALVITAIVLAAARQPEA